NVPLIGGVKAGKKEAYIAADIRLVDVRTGRVVNATKVEGKASSWKIGGLGGTLLGTVALGSGLGVYKNTPMEKAIRVMLENAVQAISQMVPESYYRYSATGQPVQPVASTQSTSTNAGGIVGGQTTGTAIAGGLPVSGAIIGGSEQFVPGEKVLFKEDFSEYNIGDIPRCFDSLQGQAEVAQFHGQKWLRALSGNVVAIKRILLPQNFAVEWYVYYTKSRWASGSEVSLGMFKDWRAPDTFSWPTDWDHPLWSGKEIKTVKIHAGEIHHFAIQQKNGMIRIFVDGKLAYKERVEGGIVGGKLPNRDAISIHAGGANPSEHIEILLTNIKVTAY
ncbi:MAG: hypothetical protein J7M03_03870, partial [Candidatus Desulfofervidaceae bacterium]|nr:hypothetical protein [Candidatus Desulfofervidaceae bacterium]